jgi:hypothetical protein
MEGLKQRIKIFLTIFQYGMSFFLGVGVSFVTYINKQMELQEITSVHALTWDVFAVAHAVAMVMSASSAIFFLIEADKVNDRLVDREAPLP